MLFVHFRQGRRQPTILMCHFDFLILVIFSSEEFIHIFHRFIAYSANDSGANPSHPPCQSSSYCDHVIREHRATKPLYTRRDRSRDTHFELEGMAPAGFFPGVGKFIDVARIFSGGALFSSKKVQDIFSRRRQNTGQNY